MGWNEKPKRVAELYVTLKHETDEARLFTDGMNEFWVPKSVHEITADHGDSDHTIEIQEWWAENEGLI